MTTINIGKLVLDLDIEPLSDAQHAVRLRHALALMPLLIREAFASLDVSDVQLEQLPPHLALELPSVRSEQIIQRPAMLAHLIATRCVSTITGQKAGQKAGQEVGANTPISAFACLEHWESVRSERLVETLTPEQFVYWLRTGSTETIQHAPLGWEGMGQQLIEQASIDASFCRTLRELVAHPLVCARLMTIIRQVSSTLGAALLILITDWAEHPRAFNGTVFNGTGTLEPVNGTGTLGPVNGTGTLGPVNGTGTLGQVNGTGTLGQVNGTGTLGQVNGTGTLGQVNGTDTLGQALSAGMSPDTLIGYLQTLRQYTPDEANVRLNTLMMLTSPMTASVDRETKRAFEKALMNNPDSKMIHTISTWLAVAAIQPPSLAEQKRMRQMLVPLPSYLLPEKRSPEKRMDAIVGNAMVGQQRHLLTQWRTIENQLHFLLKFNGNVAALERSLLLLIQSLVSLNMPPEIQRFASQLTILHLSIHRHQWPLSVHEEWHQLQLLMHVVKQQTSSPYENALFWQSQRLGNPLYQKALYQQRIRKQKIRKQKFQKQNALNLAHYIVPEEETLRTTEQAFSDRTWLSEQQASLQAEFERASIQAMTLISKTVRILEAALVMNRLDIAEMVLQLSTLLCVVPLSVQPRVTALMVKLFSREASVADKIKPALKQLLMFLSAYLEQRGHEQTEQRGDEETSRSGPPIDDDQSEVHTGLANKHLGRQKARTVLQALSRVEDYLNSAENAKKEVVQALLDETLSLLPIERQYRVSLLLSQWDDNDSSDTEQNTVLLQGICAELASSLPSLGLKSRPSRQAAGKGGQERLSLSSVGVASVSVPSAVVAQFSPFESLPPDENLSLRLAKLEMLFLHLAKILKQEEEISLLLSACPLQKRVDIIFRLSILWRATLTLARNHARSFSGISRGETAVDEGLGYIIQSCNTLLLKDKDKDKDSGSGLDFQTHILPDELNAPWWAELANFSAMRSDDIPTRQAIQRVDLQPLSRPFNETKQRLDEADQIEPTDQTATDNDLKKKVAFEGTGKHGSGAAAHAVLGVSPNEIEWTGLPAALKRQTEKAYAKETERVRQWLNVLPIKQTMQRISEHRRSLEEQVTGLPQFTMDGGLVLLAPFIPTLFERAALLSQIDDEHGNINVTFSTPDAQLRGYSLLVHLLGDACSSDYCGTANILCGYDLDDVIEPILLSDEDKQETERLLEIAVARWEALKGMPVASFQSLFLQRKAECNAREAGYSVKVAKQTIDILMQKLPWGIGMIQFPWLGKTLISVDWPY